MGNLVTQPGLTRRSFLMVIETGAGVQMAMDLVGPEEQDVLLKLPSDSGLSAGSLAGRSSQGLLLVIGLTRGLVRSPVML